MAIGPARSSRSRSERAADEALRVAREKAAGPIAKLICWDAVLYILREKNIISKSTYQRISNGTTQDDFRLFLPSECPRVTNQDELRNVPRGSILGFIKQRPGGRGEFLAHAMLYVGNGIAVGSNNGAIGQSPPFCPIDLTSPNVANWGDGPSFSYLELGSSTSRANVEVVYRDIDGMTPCLLM